MADLGKTAYFEFGWQFFVNYQSWRNPVKFQIFVYHRKILFCLPYYCKFLSNLFFCLNFDRFFFSKSSTWQCVTHGECRNRIFYCFIYADASDGLCLLFVLPIWLMIQTVSSRKCVKVNGNHGEKRALKVCDVGIAIQVLGKRLLLLVSVFGRHSEHWWLFALWYIEPS